jgi:uncharacterized protein
MLCVELHDVCPRHWPACERLIHALTDTRGPALRALTLLVVPQFHHDSQSFSDRRFCQALERRLKQGDELALHGLNHLDEMTFPNPILHPIDWARRRLYTQAEGEFSALTFEQAFARINAGLAAFKAADFPVQGFVAPAWLMSAGTRNALGQTALSWTATRTHVLPLHGQAAVAAPALTASARNAWRRTVSEGVLRVRSQWLSRPANRSIRRSVRRPEERSAAMVRLALHPADASHPRLVEIWQRVWSRLQAHRPMMTVTQALAALDGLSGSCRASA